jgi:hypothetical protein
MSVGLFAALVATFASAVGWLPEALGPVGYWAAVVLTGGIAIAFLTGGTRRGKLFGGFALVVALAFPLVQGIYERPGSTLLLLNNPLFLPLLLLLQLLAPVTAVVAGAWGLAASLPHRDATP